jgi:hypothetical protein
MNVSGHLHTPGERAPSTPWIGGWLGRRASLDAPVRGKSLTMYIKLEHLKVVCGACGCVKYSCKYVQGVRSISGLNVYAFSTHTVMSLTGLSGMCSYTDDR